MRPLVTLLVCAGALLPCSAQEILAGLYRPPAAALEMHYPPAQMDETTPLQPTLHLYGRGFQSGTGTLSYTLLAGRQKRFQGEVALDAAGAAFERSLPLPEAFPDADRVAWTLRSGKATWQGTAPLRWSRLQGRLDYVDGRPRPSYVDLHPYTFAHGFLVPVRADGTFDAQVPAGTYAVVNVNGAGYSVDAMERWAWAFDLNQDRTEVFRVGRTELYGMTAFCMVGGPSTVFIAFRPTALTRYLQHVVDSGAKPKDAATMALVVAHLKDNPQALAPELQPAGVKVWLDGTAFPVTALNRVTETTAQGINQTLYLLQITPPAKPARGVRHEIKVEIESQDVLHGQLLTDFGQGSVGLYLD